jgi:NAD(P)-dependent dehydrogenase (short-subunit alcohol dehydrogenase family)
MTMQEKVVLVTGGATGIGRGIALRFAREGARVVVAGRTRETGQAMEHELRAFHDGSRFRQADLADEAAVGALMEWINATYGRLDTAINNAGVGARRSTVEPGDPPGVRWEKLRGANLDAAFFVCAHAMPLLARSGGTIVNISSTAAGHGNSGLYGVAKAGVEGLTRAFAAEGGPNGVRVNAISPGWIATDLDAEQPASASGDGDWALPPSLLGRVGTPEEIAAAAFFLASDQASFITGQTLVVDGGLTATDYPSRSMLLEHTDRISSGAGISPSPAPADQPGRMK